MADIVRRDLLAPGAFRQAMERFFDDPFFRDPLVRWPSTMTEDGALAVDISERDGKLIVEASLPGFKKEEVDVQVHDGVLSIRAQHSEEKEERSGKYYRRERSWGSVSRRIALPGVVKDAPVEAELKNGVLTLQVALPEQSGPKSVTIKGE